jgi:hypothetical protein
MSARTPARSLVRAILVCSLLLCAYAGTALADPPSAPPVVSGADTDLWNTGPVYSVAFDGPFLLWTASNDDHGYATASPATVVSGRPFAEGPQWIRFTDQGGQTTRTFTVDLTPPGPLAVSGPATGPAGTAVAFSWTGGEPGARYTWRLDGPSAQAPVTTTTPTAQTGPLSAGSYTFTVNQTDLAGNAGPAGTATLTISPPVLAPAPPAAIARPQPVIVKLPTEHPDRLLPRAAAMVATQRPMLRWKKGPSGTRLYNVQVFRVTGVGSARASAVRLRKISSAFPHGRKMRTRTLAKGGCYVWRVWPYKAHGFTKAPLGVSHFCVMKRHRR